MRGSRTAWGAAHLDLLERLSRWQSFPMSPEVRALSFFGEVEFTPAEWPLTDVYFEILLTACGFDLTRDDHVAAGVWAFALLSPYGNVALVCDHDDRTSPFCDWLDECDFEAMQERAAELHENGAFQSLARMGDERRFGRTGVKSGYAISVIDWAAWGVLDPEKCGPEPGQLPASGPDHETGEQP